MSSACRPSSPARSSNRRPAVRASRRTAMTPTVAATTRAATASRVTAAGGIAAGGPRPDDGRGRGTGLRRRRWSGRRATADTDANCNELDRPDIVRPCFVRTSPARRRPGDGASAGFERRHQHALLAPRRDRAIDLLGRFDDMHAGERRRDASRRCAPTPPPSAGTSRAGSAARRAPRPSAPA